MRNKKCLILLALIGLLAACSDEETGIGPSAQFQQLGRFEYCLRNSQNSLVVSLDGIRKTPVRIESAMEWLSISSMEKNENGYVKLNILRLKDTPNHFVADSVYVYVSEKERATVVIANDEAIVPSGDNSASEYKAFNNKWWEQEDILYSVTHTINGERKTVSQHIPLPWAPASTSNIPASLFSHDALTANEGWMMAYNLFAAETNGNPNSKPYFMLYNKYTGTLRTFYYQAENAGSGGELSFLVTPDDATSTKYPYYHNLQYAIPVSNRNVQLKGNVLHVTRADNTFQQMVTPYVKADVVLKPGWYCFDLDWSAYNPAVSSPFNPLDRMSIDCLTANNTQITMAGTITGKSEGTIEGLANSSTSTSNGMNYLDQFKSGTDNATEALSCVLEGNYVKAAFKGVMSLWNLGKAMTGNATDDYTTETKSTGSINQSFTGKISLDGYSTSNTSNNAIGVEFSYSAFTQNQETGKGVWSLQDNPIVYVVNDRLMGDDELLSCMVESDGYSYGASDPESNNLRLMTFLDPTSIKFNINTVNFKDIRNAKMSWTYGVYPNQPAGHTDVYRTGLMNLDIDTPEFIAKKVHKGKLYKSLSSTFANMEYLEAPLADVTATSISGTTKAKIYKQKDTCYRYYAHAGNDRIDTDKDYFLVDPVMLLPTTFAKESGTASNNVGKFYDFIAPDFVVGVTLTFDYTLDDGSKAKAVFSKRFLPQVKNISTTDMLVKRTALQNYVNSGIHQTIGSVKIMHQGASKMLTQFFSTSDFIKNYDY